MIESKNDKNRIRRMTRIKSRTIYDRSDTISDFCY
jgi:hypothetical protein